MSLRICTLLLLGLPAAMGCGTAPIQQNTIDYPVEPTIETEPTDRDGDGFSVDEDCNDLNARIYPGAEEVCDGVDNDCDGLTDDASASDARAWFADADGDGFGDPARATVACEAPEAHVTDATDCNDAVATAYPGSSTICDYVDSDCDGVVEEALVPGDHATIQEAIDAGESHVCVEPGVYNESLDFGGRSGLHLEGMGGSASVELDLQGAGRGMVLQSAEQDITIQGFTVRGGYAENKGSAGILATGVAGLTLSDLVLTKHECVGLCEGTALGVLESTGVVVTDVVVEDSLLVNEDYGLHPGMVYLYDTEATVDGLTIRQNTVYSDSYLMAAALTVKGDWENLHPVSLAGVTIEDNDVSVASGTSGLYVYNTGSVDIVDMAVAGNLLESTGSVFGPIGIFAIYGILDVSHLSVVDNTTATTGFAYTGGASLTQVEFDFDLENVLIAGNHVEAFQLYAAALHVGNGTVGLRQATTHGNSALYTGHLYGGGVTCHESDIRVDNTSLTGNVMAGNDDYAGWSDLTFRTGCNWYTTHTNTRDNGTDFRDDLADWTGDRGNVSVDPEFVDVSDTAPRAWDLTLDPGSPLLDAGDPGVLDADGSVSDIGAYGGPEGADWKAERAPTSR